MKKQEKISIKPRITLRTKLRCTKCNLRIDGAEGYISLVIRPDNRMNITLPDKINYRLCNRCWKRIDKEVNELLSDEEGKKKKYKQLIREKVLKNLR